MAFLQDAQGAGELAAEVGLPPPEARQRGQRLHQRTAAQVLAEVALDTPHADHDVRCHAGLLLYFLQRVVPLGMGGAAVCHALVIDQHGQVVPHRHGEFGLAVEQHQHRGVGRQAVGVLRVGGGRDAAERRRGPEFVEAAAEFGRVDVGRRVLRQRGAGGGQGGQQGGQRAGKRQGQGHSKMIAHTGGPTDVPAQQKVSAMGR